ncbi:MAG: aldo/keto reductase [Chloroflexi bacterium]|nr:aldo/keto reductase [Chloroflexota bacterium]
MARRLGRSGIQVSALGLGTARIGGLGFSRQGDLGRSDRPAEIAESIYAIHRALDLGVNFFDTADIYGCGQSERLLGEALAPQRAHVVISTKFGEPFDEETAQAVETPIAYEYVKRACASSLRRLKTDYIDLYLFHLRDFDLARAGEIQQALEDLVQAGSIRAYGWSTDDVTRARFFAQGPGCTAIEHRLNILNDAPAMLALCDEQNLASINRVPLLMGVLTGCWTAETRLAETDRRSDWFRDKEFLRVLESTEVLRGILTRDGRSYVQGALGWIWARSARAIPIPGFRTVAQAEELARAMEFDALAESQMREIQELVH